MRSESSAFLKSRFKLRPPQEERYPASHGISQPRVFRRRVYWRRPYLLYLTVLGFLLVVYLLWNYSSSSDGRYVPAQTIWLSDNASYSATNNSCRFHTCFNIYRCRHYDGVLPVFVYSPENFHFVDSEGIPISTGGGLSKEFSEIIRVLRGLVHFTTDPEEACLLFPPLDLTNTFRVRLSKSSSALRMLPYWREYGQNHLIFTLVANSDTWKYLEIGHAVRIAVGIPFHLYRPGFDVAVPFYNSLFINHTGNVQNRESARNKLLVLFPPNTDVSQYEVNILKEAGALLVSPCFHTDSIQFCSKFDNTERLSYADTLSRSDVCLMWGDDPLFSMTLVDSLRFGCVPALIFRNEVVLPFQDVLDWSQFSIRLRQEELEGFVFRHMPNSVAIQRLRSHGHWIFQQYMSSPATILRIALEVIRERVFPHLASSPRVWNRGPTNRILPSFPLVPSSPVEETAKFTAVVLGFDRLPSLKAVISRLSRVPSLAAIIVIWNNPDRLPPSVDEIVPLGVEKVVRLLPQKENRLSNRFRPLPEIETEAVFSIDDDITMLTVDEIEFGFQVWKEFPDRLVGFPSRLHFANNEEGTVWRYDSEWRGDLSMVLTGAAFLHKYWTYVYTKTLSRELRDWVDGRMNCEDILMNFVIANVTGKAPLKVTPRKKFKCPECADVAGLSDRDEKYMQVRSECVNHFAEQFGGMVLKTVDFQVDPVLFKQNVSEELLRFRDIGSF